MQKSNQKLDTFISEITSGVASPIPIDEEDAEERIWSGEIAEINEALGTFASDPSRLLRGLERISEIIYCVNNLPGALTRINGTNSSRPPR